MMILILPFGSGMQNIIIFAWRFPFPNVLGSGQHLDEFAFFPAAWAAILNCLRRLKTDALVLTTGSQLCVCPKEPTDVSQGCTLGVRGRISHFTDGKMGLPRGTVTPQAHAVKVMTRPT